MPGDMPRELENDCMCYTFILPKSFDPLEFLKGELASRADDARWLVSTILRKMAWRDVDRGQYARLHSDIIRRAMNQRTYRKVIEGLLGGAIERVGYSSGVKSYGYGLAERYWGDDVVRVQATDPRFLKRIEREQRHTKDRQSESRLPVHDALDAEQQYLTITPEADEILVNLPERTRLCQSVLVSNIRARDLSFTISSTGRVFNAISGLKRELRPTLRLDGEKLAAIDICASQPSLLAMMLHRAFPPSDEAKNASTYSTPLPDTLFTPLTAFLSPLTGSGLPSDLVCFADDARNGMLYENLADLVGWTRERTKKGFLRDVLAKRGGYPSKLEDAFREAYPTVYAAVRQINKGNHCKLIRLLQGVEAWLVIEQVCPRLLDNGVRCLTLHDAVYSQARMIDKVEEAFEETCDEVGFPLSLKREPESPVGIEQPSVAPLGLPHGLECQDLPAGALAL